MDPGCPSAPHIDGEAMLEIFVHSSIKFTGKPMNSESVYADGPRLATIGSAMLEASYAAILFNKRPMLTAEELEASRSELPDLVEKWVEQYKWREKVRHAPGVDLRKPEETRYLMDAYVGAVYAGGGFQAVMNWIAALVDPGATPPQVQQGQYEPESKRTRFEPSQPQYTYQPQPQPQPAFAAGYGMPSYMPPAAPPPPAVAPPPLPAHNPLAPAQPHSAFLPVFNQTAQQRRLEVQYPAQFSGPAHAGRWTVQCLVNGLEKGVGTGPSKQLAKEEAARQAYFAMGWAPHYNGSSNSHMEVIM
ncbi:hypothetical protein C8Q74DRAFT_1214781 [Fomes fomentarius]|nr:hypothetical protein C8Q74DRAFT_1214781 [Fomes fomentarius]